MRFIAAVRRFRLLSALIPGFLAVAAPASADWTRVADVPVTFLFAVWADGDTIAAAGDTAAFLSTDGGASWRTSARPAKAVTTIQTVWFRNGRLYAGTFGQGVFVSDDRGETWQAFNEGLVGGPLNSQVFVVDLQVRDGNLYAATAGAGVWVRSLEGPSTWQPIGGELELQQASNVNTLALGGVRLLASAGVNGAVFRNDPGDADWTVSNLDNAGLVPGLGAFSAAWTGTGWVVGTNVGVFRSIAGQEPWTPSGPGLGGLIWAAFATRSGHLFAAFVTPTVAFIQESDDDGATWHDDEPFPAVVVLELAIGGGHLYAARSDGLWRRSLGTVSVPSDARRPRLHFALAGPHPFADRTRLRFDLPEAGSASIEIFDALGRVAGDRIEGSWSAGPHVVALDARRLNPGVYSARLTAAGTAEVLRLVHVR